MINYDNLRMPALNPSTRQSKLSFLNEKSKEIKEKMAANENRQIQDVWHLFLASFVTNLLGHIRVQTRRTLYYILAMIRSIPLFAL